MALTLLEAMSYGNCCLVSDICENTEVTEDKAFSFRKGDVKDLKSKLEYMLANPEIVKEYGSRSVDFICGKYNWDDVVGQTVALYRKVSGEKTVHPQKEKAQCGRDIAWGLCWLWP